MAFSGINHVESDLALKLAEITLNSTASRWIIIITIIEILILNFDLYSAIIELRKMIIWVIALRGL